MSRVDVIVPCCDYGHFLRECVASVQAQHGVQVRVLVIDDASTDDTAEIATQLAAADGRITFRRHAVNQGLVATKNEGLEWASGEYLMLLDADDVLTPGALFRATRLMNDHPEVGLIHGRARVTREPGSETFGIEADRAWHVVDGLEWIEGVCATGVNAVRQPTVVVRTSLQKELGGYRPELPHAGDMEMWLRFAAHGSIGMVDVDQACYRMHATNMNYRYKGILDLRQRKTCFELFFSKFGHRLADGRRLRRSASRCLAEEALCETIVCLKENQINACGKLLAYALSLDPAHVFKMPGRWLKRVRTKKQRRTF